MRGVIILILVLVLLGGVYVYTTANNEIVVDEDSPVDQEVIEMNEIMEDNAVVVATGDFRASAHDVNGNVLLIKEGEKRVVRFEDFETINGPELHIYLSSDLNAEDYVDIGLIKATKGNVNYEVPNDVDLDKYNNVLVWCKPFSVLFSYAKLE